MPEKPPIASPATLEQPKTPESPVPTPEPAVTHEEDKLNPTRYGDWEKNGRCIDF